MSGDMPDWLAGLVSAPEDEDEDQPLTAAAWPQASAVQSQVAAPQPQVSVFEAEDMMADLRSQVAEEVPAQTSRSRRSRSRKVFGLLPWQIFLLSLFMFLDVAVIGMLFLVMLGRVVLPY